MTNVNFWLKRLIKEWLFLFATLGVAATSIYLKRIPHYDFSDFRILFLIFSFLIVLKGVEKSHILQFVAFKLSREKFIALKLVFLVGFLSMFLTNDISLLIVVPITLVMDIKQKDLVVIMEAISANAFSSLIPSGNPQNMFIYWFYNLNFSQFVKTIYPFTVISAFAIFLITVFIRSAKDVVEVKEIEIKKGSYVYIFLLVVIILVVLKVLPFWVTLAVIIYAAIFERRLFLIDYFLLGIFFMFFGFTDNLQEIIHITSVPKGSVFIISAVLSQFMSNVPATLFLADFTKAWKELLWGVSVGGYGNLIGSLANLIAYRIYVTRYPDKQNSFLVKFLGVGYFFFFLLVFVYMLLFRV